MSNPEKGPRGPEEELIELKPFEAEDVGLKKEKEKNPEPEVFGEIGGIESLSKYIKWDEDSDKAIRERMEKDITDSERLLLEDALMSCAASKIYFGLISSRVEKGENMKDIVRQDRDRIKKDQPPRDRIREFALRHVEGRMETETLRKEDAEKK